MREEAHFFDEDTYRFSVSLQASPNPFVHWEISEEEKDYNWDEYESCNKAAKRRMRKLIGKLAYVGMSSNYSDEEIKLTMCYYDMEGI